MKRTLLLTVLLTSCATQPRTEVIVSIDADGPVRAHLTGLRVQVRGGTGDPSTWGVPVIRPEPPAWPVQVGIIPTGDDSARSFEVTAVATGAMGDFAVARVVSTFEPQRTLSLPLRLEADCIGVPCPPDQACRASTCASPVVPPTNIDPAPVDFSGTFTVTVTAGPNGCMFPSWTVGAMSMGVPAMVTQMPGDPHVTVDIGGAPGLFLDVVEHSHHFVGTVYGNHLTATLVGTNNMMSGTCNPFTINAILSLDLMGANVTGTIEAYGVGPDTTACMAITGCSSSETVVGARM